MDIRELPDHGLVMDGHDISRADALAAARTYLVGAGMSAFEADTATIDRPGAVAQAWWSREHGFVNAPNDDNGHHGGQPVTVIHVEVPQ